VTIHFPAFQHLSHHLLLILPLMNEKAQLMLDFFDRLKDTPMACLFLEREVKIDISGLRKKPPAGRSQPRAQRKRVAVGSEEQQNERAMRFVMK
ncbi:MAG TPA: hypothetical protein H9839_02150, partial [Candidatus Intestinimonas stercorigallinarum]|nr:hypothetical protein [Candidatus Intestinimonas stercorigallinarum]